MYDIHDEDHSVFDKVNEDLESVLYLWEMPLKKKWHYSKTRRGSR